MLGAIADSVDPPAEFAPSAIPTPISNGARPAAATNSRRPNLSTSEVMISEDFITISPQPKNTTTDLSITSITLNAWCNIVHYHIAQCTCPRSRLHGPQSKRQSAHPRARTPRRLRISFGSRQCPLLRHPARVVIVDVSDS